MKVPSGRLVSWVPESTSMLAAGIFTTRPATLTPTSRTKYCDGRSRLGTIGVNCALAGAAAAPLPPRARYPVPLDSDGRQ